MDRTYSEKIFSSISYAIVLAGLVLMLVFVMGYEWAPLLVLGFGVASAAVVALCLRGSRYTLVHSLNAFFLYLHTAVLSTAPLIIQALVRHGYLLPRPVGPNRHITDVVPYTLAAVCIFIGLPLLMITSQAMMQALQGEFLENWPPLRWLRDWLIGR